MSVREIRSHPDRAADHNLKQIVPAAKGPELNACLFAQLHCVLASRDSIQHRTYSNLATDVVSEVLDSERRKRAAKRDKSVDGFGFRSLPRIWYKEFGQAIWTFILVYLNLHSQTKTYRREKSRPLSYLQRGHY